MNVRTNISPPFPDDLRLHSGGRPLDDGLRPGLLRQRPLHLRAAEALRPRGLLRPPHRPGHLRRLLPRLLPHHIGPAQLVRDVQAGDILQRKSFSSLKKHYHCQISFLSRWCPLCTACPTSFACARPTPPSPSPWKGSSPSYTPSR